MPAGRDRHRVAVGVADALPLGDRAPRDRLGEDQRPLLVGGRLGQRLDGGVAARRHHQRGGERRGAQAHAVAEVEPARLGGEVESEHALLSPFGGSGDGARVARRPALQSLRACRIRCRILRTSALEVGYRSGCLLQRAASISLGEKRDTVHATLVASGFTSAEGQQGSVGSRYVLLANRPRPEGTSQCQRS